LPSASQKLSSMRNIRCLLKRWRLFRCRCCTVHSPPPTNTHAQHLLLDNNRLTGTLPKLKPPLGSGSKKRRGSADSHSSVGSFSIGRGGGGPDAASVGSASANMMAGLDEFGDPIVDDGFDADDGWFGGLRGMSSLVELGLGRNLLNGHVSLAVNSLPRGVQRVRLDQNAFDERRPKIRNSHLGAALGPPIVRLVAPRRHSNGGR